MDMTMVFAQIIKLIRLRLTKILIFVFIICNILLYFSYADSNELPYKIFKLKYLKAKDTVPLIKILLSTDGKAIADERLNLLIVSDYSNNLLKVENFLSKYDVFPANVKIEARITSEDELTRCGVLINWQVVDNLWRVSTIASGESKIKSHQEMNLLVMSGFTGKISTGIEVPYPHLIYIYTVNQGYNVIGAVDFYEVSSGLTVTPIAIIETDEIELVVEPYISYNSGDNKTGEIKFKEIKTTVRIKNGESIAIGGNQQIKENIINNILSGSLEQKEKTNFLVILKATIIK